MTIKIGQGIDFHKLEKGKDLFLGGVKIPSGKGAVAHSDGDVLLHAICDALLGAAGLQDIGNQFPDTSDEYRNIDSKILLKKTFSLITSEGYRAGNIDCTVCLETPRISAFIPGMKETIANILDIESASVSIKATTTEKMGFVGRGEGIGALASVLLLKD
jgi:2-C-methyl-D-erythritol 2,4-cyclodiphosphate synthase